MKSTKWYEKYTNSKIEKAQAVFYLYPDGTIELIKNRYGSTGTIEGSERIKVLVELLANLAFNNTCVIFQEVLKKKIYKVLEGEGYDKI